MPVGSTLTAAAAMFATAASAMACPLYGGEPTLEEVRAATERFRDVNVALAEGYARDPLDLCDTADMMGRPAELGAMGIHFARADLLGITAPPDPRVDGDGIHTDFLQPSILIYEPQADGSLELVAVENLVFAEAWKTAGREAVPTFHGVAVRYHGGRSRDAGRRGAPLRAALRPACLESDRDNPNGVFAPFNPAVTCEHHQNGAAQHATHRG